MKILIISLSLILFSCSGAVEGWQVQKAIEFCADKGTIDRLNNLSREVTCKDGSHADYFDLRK